MTGRTLWLGFALFFTAGSVYAEIPDPKDAEFVEKRFAEMADKHWVALTKEQSQRSASAFVEYLKMCPQRFDTTFLNAFLDSFWPTNRETPYEWSSDKRGPFCDEEVILRVAELKQDIDMFVSNYFRPKEEWAQVEAQARQFREMTEQDLRRLYAGLEQEPFVRMHHEEGRKKILEPVEKSFNPLEAAVREQVRYFTPSLEALVARRSGTGEPAYYDSHFHRPLGEDEMKNVIAEWRAALKKWERIPDLIPTWKAGIEEILKEPDIAKRRDRYEQFLGGGFMKNLPPEDREQVDPELYSWGVGIHESADGDGHMVIVPPGPSMWELMKKVWTVPESQEVKDARKAVEERVAREKKERDAAEKKEPKENK